MEHPIIQARKVSKRYRLGGQKDAQHTIRDALARKLSVAGRRAESDSREFWALKDVSFDVRQGEAVGIVGRNGAGKSTLLKVLSRITPPTEGEIVMRGNVASLLEVGTGFHPELSGRENIFLNGAILGMTRKDIAQRFDEIVDFAGVERFLETPVKRYSSGMYVRLAFAVAAHLEPDILIVDEVLAVGDSEFQKKCLGKMGEVAKGGRTVLFVSHNIAAVASLCTKVLLLKTGEVLYSGEVQEGLRTYAQSIRSDGDAVRTFDTSSRDSQGSITRVELVNQRDDVTERFVMGERWMLRFEIALRSKTSGLRLSFRVTTDRGERVYHCVAKDDQFQPTLDCGTHTVAAELDPLALYPGTYIVADLWLASGTEVLDKIPDVLTFTVEESGIYPSRDVNPSFALVHQVARWSIDQPVTSATGPAFTPGTRPR